MEFLKGHEAPVKLMKIYSYLQSEDAAGLDLRIPFHGKETLTDLLGSETSESLIPLFSLHHGSILASWIKQESLGIQGSPVLWIDSEGEPNAVFADDLDQLLGLMHFHLGSIYDVLKAIKRHEANSVRYKPVLDRYPEQKFLENAHATWLENAALRTFHEWLTTSLEIPLLTNPVEAISTAYSTNEKFHSPRLD